MYSVTKTQVFYKTTINCLYGFLNLSLLQDPGFPSWSRITEVVKVPMSERETTQGVMG